MYGLNKNESRSIIIGTGKKESEMDTPLYSEGPNTAKKRKEKPQNNLTQH